MLEEGHTNSLPSDGIQQGCWVPKTVVTNIWRTQEAIIQNSQMSLLTIDSSTPDAKIDAKMMFTRYDMLRKHSGISWYQKATPSNRLPEPWCMKLP